MSSAVTLACALAVAVGVAGTVVPVLPGALLVGAAVGTWAVFARTTAGWFVLAAVALVLLTGQVLKVLTAGRTMTASGVPRRSLAVAGLGGLGGFFALPVLGLPVGFVLGLLGAERLRLGAAAGAGASTVVALRAVGLAVLVEVTAALLAAGIWLAAVLGGAGG